MRTLEEKIVELLVQYNERCDRDIGVSMNYHIEQWTFRNVPYSIRPDYLEYFDSLVLQTFINLDRLIEESSPAEALTSTSEYIRKCKEWYIRRDRQQKLATHVKSEQSAS